MIYNYKTVKTIAEITGFDLDKEDNYSDKECEVFEQIERRARRIFTQDPELLSLFDKLQSNWYRLKILDNEKKFYLVIDTGKSSCVYEDTDDMIMIDAKCSYLSEFVEGDILYIPSEDPTDFDSIKFVGNVYDLNRFMDEYLAGRTKCTK